MISQLSCLAVAASMLVRTTEAAVAIGLASVSPHHPEMCMDDSTGTAYGLGSAWQMKDTCGQQTCTKRGNTLYISYETCGYTQASPPCYTVENLSLSYPSCCPRVVCEPTFTNEINIDDYSQYDETAMADELYMMSSNDSPNFVSYDIDMEEDLLAVESNHDYHDDYMVDWDTLFGSFQK